MSKEKKDNWNWKLAVSAVAATAIAGLTYYLGYITAKEEELDKSEAGPSSAVNAHFEPPEECSICKKDMAPLKRLNCGHHFHDECISQWLPLSSTCPLCRADQSPK